MATHIHKEVDWRAGEGTPPKYQFELNADVEVVSLVGTTATLRIYGTVTLRNHPLDSRNIWKASDFAVLTLGGYDPADYQFTQGVEYYQTALPALPNAPQEYVDAVLVEFRGDTYITDGNNKVSLYRKNSGVVIDKYEGSDPQVVPIDLTFSIDIQSAARAVNVPILIWNTSGASSSTSYEWLDHEVWLSWFDLDYRPGAIINNDQWFSHNRANGASNVFNGTEWVEMRTVDGAVGTSNPPSMRHDSDWKNMRKVGIEQ